MGAEPPDPVLVSGAPPGELLEVAVRAAGMAGEMLLERFREGQERTLAAKSTPTDLVSEADLASERAICELLGRLRPEDGFLGEEGGEVPGNSGLRWIVDPLDGTVNFLFGIPQWCVSVAVEDSEGTVAGAIFDPNRRELFAAARGAPAGLTLGAGSEGALRSPIEVTRRTELSAAMLATGFAYDARVRAAQARVLERVIPKVRDIRRLGSAALDLAWTALGRYDAYFERTVKPWDIAAGVLICEAAGLRVLELPVHRDLPGGILATSETLAGPLLELVGAAA